MKTMTVFEARNHFSRTLEAAKEDVIIVTRNGRPVAAIQAIDDDDVEDLLLERSERFWASGFGQLVDFFSGNEGFRKAVEGFADGAKRTSPFELVQGASLIADSHEAAQLEERD